MKKRILASLMAMAMVAAAALPAFAEEAAAEAETIVVMGEDGTAYVEETPAEEAATAEEEAPAPDAAPAEEAPAEETPAPEATEAPAESVTPAEPATVSEHTAEAPAPAEPAAEQSAPETESEATYESSGQCGANLTWTYDGNTLTISGTGDMYDQPYFPYGIRSVVINEGVTSIARRAFDGESSLASVSIAGSVREIGFCAFGDCTALTEVTVPSGKIGESAFIRCTGLKFVNIGAGVTDIGISAFENCTGLTAVNINDLTAWCNIYFGGYLANPLQYAKHLVLNGSDITDLRIPDGVTSIGDYAFQYMESLTGVTIPASVTSIGDYAFYSDRALVSVSFTGDGLKTVGASAFDSCTSLKNLTIPSTVNYIGSYGFAYIPITTATVQQGFIGSYAFKSCGAMGTLNLGEGVTTIRKGAFYNCTALRNNNVNYSGSAAQWGVLDIAEENDDLLKSTLTCTGTGDAKIIVPDTSGVYVGATVQFGQYEQDGNPGADTLTWQVLDVQGDRALILSDNVLSFMRYGSNSSDWASSYVRNWLNGSFLNDAFTAAQAEQIYTTELYSTANPRYGTAGGSASNDKIFILSAEEAERYIPHEEDRMANWTTAISSTSDTGLHNNVLDSSYWWLRSAGMYSYGAMYVHYTGSVRYDGMDVENVITGVRPAMWVNTGAVTVVPDASAGKLQKIAGFVTRLYSVCLDREPDEGGKADWIGRLVSGNETGVTAAYGFVFSQEFRNKNFCNECFVKQLYRAFMGREYDDAGLKDWVNRLESGSTREEVFNGFALSAEFGKLCSDYGITQGDGIAIPQYGTVPTGACSVCGKQDGVTGFVTRMYKVALDREPDAAGLKDWTNRLWAHTASGTDIGLGFIFSEEFTNKAYNNADYVERLYEAFMGRASDAAGKADWVGKLDGGTSRLDVFNGFAASQEFTNICNSYGIVRG